MKLLIVDDNEQNLYMLRVLLEGHGYEVVTAGDGAEALEKARRDPPDMIISDILMPVMDGFALCREWKKDEGLKAIPFVFYTATYTDPKDEEFALSLGAERFIVKPQEPDVFMEMLRKVLENYEAGRLIAPGEPVKEEAVYFKEYNEALIRKLEDKMLQLEEANRALERDIAERKRAEEATRHAYAELDQIFNTSADGMRVVDKDFTVLRTNKTFATLSGISQDEAVGKKCYEVFPGPACHTVNCPLTRILGGEKRVEYDAEKQRSDGTRIPCIVTATPFRGLGGDLIGIVEDFKDITERKQAEEALRESEIRFRTLVEQLPAITYIAALDESSTTLYVSPQIEKTLGISPEEYKANPDFWLEHLDDEDRERVLEEVSRAHETGQPFVSEYRMISTDGRIVWVGDKAVIVKDEQGNPLCLQGVMFDITERKRAEEELGKHREHLEELVRERTADLRKVINAMAGREVRMAELKGVIRKLRAQLEEAGLTPAADDPLAAWRGDEEREGGGEGEHVYGHLAHQGDGSMSER